MDDYLSNLVAKNLSPEESINPRLPSRFEQPLESFNVHFVPEEDRFGENQTFISPPSNPVAPPPVRDSSAQETPDIPTPARLPLAPEQEPARQPYRGILTYPSDAPPLIEPQSVGRDEGLWSPPKDFPLPIQQPLQPDTSSQLNIGQEMPLSRNEESANPPSPATQQVTEVFVERIVERSLTPAPTLDPELKLPRRIESQGTNSDTLEVLDVQPVPDSQIIQPEPMEASTSQDKPTEAFDLQPVVSPLLEIAVPNEFIEPAPTVQVTIGRIEVRANPPAKTPVRRPSPKPAVMSLDEYLRKRSNGDGQ